MQVYRPKQARRVLGMVNGTQEERRARQRYPLRLPLSYRILRRGQKSELGETIDISSKGVLFKAAQPIPIRTGLEILADWPVAGPGGGILKLELFARTIRSNGDLVAAMILSHRLLTWAADEDDPIREMRECVLK